MSATDTPRCDALFKAMLNDTAVQTFNDFARQLERELTQAKEELAQVNASWNREMISHGDAVEQCERLKDQLYQAHHENAELRAKLKVE